MLVHNDAFKLSHHVKSIPPPQKKKKKNKNYYIGKMLNRLTAWPIQWITHYLSVNPSLILNITFLVASLSLLL